MIAPNGVDREDDSIMKTWTTLGIGAVALGLWSMPARAGDAVKDLPGPIDSLQDLQDTGKMLFKIADENNDGEISQKEAIDAGNLLVGGFFFRADQNGDGVLSKAELRQARDQVLAQKPVLRVILQRAKANNPERANESAQNAAQGVMSLLDTNNDGQLQASELRQMVQTSVQGVFASTDTNRDGQLSPTEVNAAIVGAARAAAQAAFQKADSDRNGQLSQAEFDKALIEPANALFHLLDANNDGQISPQEAQTAERFIADRVRQFNVPEPANSARNLLRSGRKPSDVAPIPNINVTPPSAPTAPPATAPVQ
jgi:Ca2+-binding EF-hand superfamily protein